MPSSRVNIVSPVSGVTTPLGVVISIDFEYNEVSDGYLMVKCVHPAPGPEIVMVKSIPVGTPPGTGNVTIPHTVGFTGVEIEARLTDTNTWGAYYANSSVDEIAISGNPPVKITPPANTDSHEKPVWSFELASDAYAKRAKAANASEYEHEYDPSADKEITGKVADAYKDGTLQAAVFGKKKFSLTITHLIKSFSPDPATGKWSLSIPKGVLKGGNKPRRLVVALFDNAGEYVGTASTALKKKGP